MRLWMGGRATRAESLGVLRPPIHAPAYVAVWVACGWMAALWRASGAPSPVRVVLRRPPFSPEAGVLLGGEA